MSKRVDGSSYNIPPCARLFSVKAIRAWLNRLGVRTDLTLFIEPGSPWENGYIESFNGKLRRLIAGVSLSAYILPFSYHSLGKYHSIFKAD